MTCPGCKADAKSGARFCEECGSKLSQLKSQEPTQGLIRTDKPKWWLAPKYIYIGTAIFLTAALLLGAGLLWKKGQGRISSTALSKHANNINFKLAAPLVQVPPTLVFRDEQELSSTTVIPPPADKGEPTRFTLASKIQKPEISTTATAVTQRGSHETASSPSKATQLAKTLPGVDKREPQKTISSSELRIIEPYKGSGVQPYKPYIQPYEPVTIQPARPYTIQPSTTIPLIQTIDHPLSNSEPLLRDRESGGGSGLQNSFLAGPSLTPKTEKSSSTEPDRQKTETERRRLLTDLDAVESKISDLTTLQQQISNQITMNEQTANQQEQVSRSSKGFASGIAAAAAIAARIAAEKNKSTLRNVQNQLNDFRSRASQLRKSIQKLEDVP